ncbi:hypothetical protein C7475_101399 [Chitinophaga sp. S165]|nr:hypothetical protein C7475_101399 [Chitinophaga sp. S165]
MIVKDCFVAMKTARHTLTNGTKKDRIGSQFFVFIPNRLHFILNYLQAKFGIRKAGFCIIFR